MEIKTSAEQENNKHGVRADYGANQVQQFHRLQCYIDIPLQQPLPPPSLSPPSLPLLPTWYKKTFLGATGPLSTVYCPGSHINTCPI